MIVLVCGGRDYEDQSQFTRIMEEHLPGITQAILHGGAAGADTMAGSYAHSRGIPEIVIKPNWARYGRGAGPIRNGWMIDLVRPEFVIAFPGGSGTADMVRKAKNADIPVLEVM